MIDPATLPWPCSADAVLETARSLDLAEFLGGPGRGMDDIAVDPIFGTSMATALKDLRVDAGAASSLNEADPLPEALLGPVLHRDASVCYRVVTTEDHGLSLGVAALDGDGRPAGLYTGATLVVTPVLRGLGIGTRLVVLRFLLDDGHLPCWDHDTPGYTPDGLAVHRRALDVLRDLEHQRRQTMHGKGSTA